MCARQCPNIPPRIDLLGGSCQLSSLGRELVLLDIILHSCFDILRPILSTCPVWELALSKIPKLVTVVNILSHLGTTHPTQLEEAVQEALQVTSLLKEKVADG